jgi:cytochrome c oxidase subunit 3
VGLAAIVMFFAAFTSIFIVLRASREWVHTPMPVIIWVNTGMLVLSSAALEIARRGLRHGHRTAFNVLWTAGTALGVAFLAGQYVAWRQLMDTGLHVNSNPSSAFFYIFTATHAAHILGGVLALIYVNVQALRLRLGPGKRTIADLSTVYWHFVDGIWIYLLVLLAVWG